MSESREAKPAAASSPTHAGEALWYGYIQPAQYVPVPDSPAFSAALVRLARRWRWIATAALLGALLGLTASYALAPRYRATTVVSISLPEAEGIAAGLGSRLGGLASLAGLNLSVRDHTQEAIATLGSRALAEQFIELERVGPAIFADKWDSSTGQWRSQLDPKDIPTPEQVYREFSERVRGISEDRRTGLVTVSMTWREPKLAARWANAYVALGNERMRERVLRDVRASLAFLVKQAEAADTVEMRQAVYQLIEAQKKQEMLASVRPEFAFRVIDPAMPPDPDNYEFPKRPLLTLAASFVSMLIAAALVLLTSERPK